MSLTYDNFRFYWAVVTEKRLKCVYANCKGNIPISAGILNYKIGFFSGHRYL